MESAGTRQDRSYALKWSWDRVAARLEERTDRHDGSLPFPKWADVTLRYVTSDTMKERFAIRSLV
jgi:hypothetical protein